jgi:outer membrane protein assembly factor BamB
VTVGSGDEYLYRLRTDPRRLAPARRVLWRYRALRPPATGQLVNWWEGNAVTGFGGTVFAGNTGGGAYAISSRGRRRWVFQAGNSVWTAPALARDGRSFWGSLDLSVYGLDASGAKLWSTATVGFVTSSPALSRDERTLYIGSFDGRLYALDARTGAVLWSFRTTDHVYSSPALLEDARGRVRSVVVGSTDGSIYALSAAGRLLWRYDTGDVVRSSPVLGRLPGGGSAVYVGSGNGSLYALDARTGARRWSYDTTPRDPVLADRNDLNGSPALGPRGVYIGGEHGLLAYVPYDYCLHRRDARCTTSRGEAFPDDGTQVRWVTSGGSTLALGAHPTLSPSSTLNARLVVRRHGTTVDAAMGPDPDAASLVRADPPFSFTAQLSGDGHFLHVVPIGFLAPGREYRLRVRGPVLTGGTPQGNTVVGARPTGRFSDVLRFRTGRAQTRGAPLRVGRSAVGALEISRLAVPLPPLLASVNQIGFDSYDLLAGPVATSGPDARGEGSVLLWVVGARRGADGIARADPRGGFAFALAGRYRDDSLALRSDALSLTFTFGRVPFRRFELRAQLDRRGRALPGSSLYAEVTCVDVPNYGPVLYLTGICDDEGTLGASGTFLARRYDGRGGANRRPAGVSLGDVALTRPGAARAAAGEAVATVRLARGAAFRAREHALGLLLVDDATGVPVALDYERLTTPAADARGNLTGVRVRIPAGTALPARVRAYVIADVFPLGSTRA